jgi:site-specific DNA recombinase
VRQDYLDKVVWDEVVALLEDPGLIQREIEKRIEETKKASPVMHQKAAIEKQRTQLTQSMDKLLDAYQEGLIPISQLRKRMPELQKRLNTTDKELETLKTHELALDQRLQLLDVKSFTSQLDRNIDYLDIKEKKKILRLLVKEVIVGDDIIDIKHSIPLKEGKNEQNDKSYQLCTRSTYTSLRSAFCPGSYAAICLFYACLQPSLCVEQHPLLLRMMAHHLHHPLMADIVKETFDV